jgi:type II secretory pathway component GspD/PulD (secretin)
VAARAGSDSSTRVFGFSSFGLSQVDADTGRLALTPGLGFNGAVLNADVADVVLRALSTHSRSRIVAAPRVLVNDNATGTLFSIAESPFTSVNAANTISTTSFAGYADAGTEITLTPHISEEDYLQLQYVVSLSSFTGQGTEGIPPPRQTDKVASEVTIPDGATIVVGGLNRRQDRATLSAVPLLGDVPLLGNLFRSRTANQSNTTLFVFIRPIILRDDKFADLKFLSERDRRGAGLPDGFPGSEPLVVR